MTHSTDKPEQPDKLSQDQINKIQEGVDFMRGDDLIQSLQSRIKELEQELSLKTDEAARYRHANCILLDDDRETALLNEINRLQIREQELQKHNDHLICVAHDSELKAKELQQERDKLAGVQNVMYTTGLIK